MRFRNWKLRIKGFTASYLDKAEFTRPKHRAAASPFLANTETDVLRRRISVTTSKSGFTTHGTRRDVFTTSNGIDQVSGDRRLRLLGITTSGANDVKSRRTSTHIEQGGNSTPKRIYATNTRQRMYLPYCIFLRYKQPYVFTTSKRNKARLRAQRRRIRTDISPVALAPM